MPRVDFDREEADAQFSVGPKKALELRESCPRARHGLLRLVHGELDGPLGLVPIATPTYWLSSSPGVEAGRPILDLLWS